MNFSINIRNPRSGWLDLDLQVGEWQLKHSVSAVANDPVRELAELALFIVRNDSGRARVVFWLEPAGYELAAVRDHELELLVRYSKHAFANLFDPELVLEHQIDPTQCVAEILRCLRAAQPVFAVSDRAAWSHPFPTAVLDELEAMVSA